MRVGMRKNRLLGALVKRALPPGVGVPVWQWEGRKPVISGLGKRS